MSRGFLSRLEVLRVIWQKNHIMAYFNPQQPVQPRQPQQNVPVNWQNVSDTVKSPFAGFWAGLSGGNKTFEQWMTERKRKKRQSWMQQLMRQQQQNPR